MNMTLPNSWDKISLEQYAKIRRISKIEPKSDIERLDNLIKIVQVVINCDQDTAEKFTLKEIEVFNEFLKSPVGTTIVKHFKVNKTFFEIELNPNNLSAWRHAGVMNALKDVDANMHLIIFSLARPYKWIAGVKKKYFELKESEIPDVVLAINQLPVSLAYPLIVFFFNLSNELTNSFHDYSESKLKEMSQSLTTVKTNLQKDMDGSKRSKTLANN